ncbi:MAG: hemolysin family protein [Rhodospirillales bacterium]
MTADDSSRSNGNGNANGNGNGNGHATGDGRRGGLGNWMKNLFRVRDGNSSLRDSLDELMEDHDGESDSVDESARALLANIIELRDLTVYDVCVPRADIVAVTEDATLEAVLEIMTESGHSRLPIYGETLDDVLGMVHIKDLIAHRDSANGFNLKKVMRRILFVSPSMRVLELLLEMRVTRSHMAIVVDEFGGVDGLATIEDLVEEIVGEIEDEHDAAPQQDLIRRPDGTYEADARIELDLLEETLGAFLDEEEREDIDTLGGLVFSLAGHVPIRGELINHPAGLEFQVMEADPRRIKRVRIRIPKTNDSDD